MLFQLIINNPKLLYNLKILSYQIKYHLLNNKPTKPNHSLISLIINNPNHQIINLKLNKKNLKQKRNSLLYLKYSTLSQAFYLLHSESIVIMKLIIERPIALNLLATLCLDTLCSPESLLLRFNCISTLFVEI